MKEAYARARMQIMSHNVAQSTSQHGSIDASASESASASVLVSASSENGRKRAKAAKKRLVEARRAKAWSETSSSRASSRPGTAATTGTQYSTPDEALAAARFALSLEPTALPAKPSLGWVLSALGAMVLPKLGRGLRGGEGEGEGSGLGRFCVGKRGSAVGPGQSGLSAEELRRWLREVVLWVIARQRGRTKEGRLRAARTIQACWRAFLARRVRRRAATVIQRRWTTGSRF